MSEPMTDADLGAIVAQMEDTTGFQEATWTMVERLIAEVRRLREEVDGRVHRLSKDLAVALTDLHEMVRALGLPDVARPITPHEVMGKCIAKVNLLHAENDSLRVERMDMLGALVRINLCLRGEGDVDDYAIDIAEGAIARVRVG